MKKIFPRVILFLIASSLLSCNIGGVSRADLPERPNIIFFLTDDMTVADLEYMPRTSKLIQKKGAYFEKFYVNISLCCPSRASILRGQYGHNTKIYDIEPPNGGFERTYAMGIEASMLPVWLSDVGYSTALFGKYMATYPHTAEIDYIPPGWTEWYSPVKGFPYDGYNYTNNENGNLVEYGEDAEDYITDVISDNATDFITRNLNQGHPFFAYISTYAPHRPSTPAPRHAGLFSSLKLPRPPSFNEDDMQDKLKSIMWKKPLTDEEIAYLEEHYRLRIESLQAVDEMVERIVTVLEVEGQLDNTYIFFTSDNGIQMGEHRLVEKKNYPYEESMRVPMLVMGPGIRKGMKIDEITGNIDIAPTIAELTGATTASFVDGRSLLPLLLGEKIENWRDVYLFQCGITVKKLTEVSPWVGLRTDRYLYLEFSNGTIQIYDLKKDPYELNNFYSTADQELLDSFHLWLDKLRTCAAESCREYEVAP